MLVNTPNGTAEAGSNGKTNTALGLGIAGLATSLLSGGMSLLGGGGLGRGGYYNQNDPDSRVITKAEANLMHENSDLRTKNAILEAGTYTDKKIVETVTYVNNQLRRLEDKVDANEKSQQAVNAQQMAHNAASDAAVGILQSQTQALLGITKMYVPSSNVCQSGCGCGCNA